jgi:exopolyphosphatase/guanosine-5'-triphosphate,3'-diphosphate pyrophosphatase
MAAHPEQSFVLADPWDDSDPAVPAFLAMAASVEWSREHMLQVARIAAGLWDATRELHLLSEQDRRLLVLAALGHDVGYAIGGRKGHHKAAERVLLDLEPPDVDSEDRRTIAAIARYHRRALPDEERHANYAGLPRDRRRAVDWCGGLLRLADGLDRAHDSSVVAVAARLDGDVLFVEVECARPCGVDVDGGRRKTDLLEAVSGLRVRVASAPPGREEPSG